MSNKTGELVVKTKAKHAVAEKISADARHTSDSSSGDFVDDIDGDYGSYGDHVFADPAVAAHWAAVYDKASYEGRHRFDPAFTWSATEEKAVRKRVCHQYTPTHATSNLECRSITALCCGAGGCLWLSSSTGATSTAQSRTTCYLNSA